MGAVYQETHPSQLLHKRFRITQRLLHHVVVDVVSRDVLGPVAPLLDEELRVNSLLVENVSKVRN